MDSATAAAWVTALATFIAASAAVAAALAARRTLRQMREDSTERRKDSARQREDSADRRRDSARANRPYVHARLVPSIAGTDSWDLIVENTGRTAAHDLLLQIDAASIPDDKVTGPVLRMAKARLSVNPGQRIRTFWVVEATKSDALGFPPANVTVSYRDSEGEEYVERTLRLDPEDFGLTPVPSKGPRTDPRNHERDVIHALGAIARHIGEGNR